MMRSYVEKTNSKHHGWRIWPGNKGLRDLMSDREEKETNDPRGISWGEMLIYAKYRKVSRGWEEAFAEGPQRC